MAVIRIPVVNEPRQNPIRYFDEAGQLHELPLLRLRTDILIGADPGRPSEDRRPQFPAILDTGAPVTVFPRRVWQWFEPAITRLRVAGERPRAGSAGGRRFTYFLGRVSVAVTDLFGRRLRAVPVLAQFREDDIPEGEPRAAVLLGLGGRRPRRAHPDTLADRRAVRRGHYDARESRTMVVAGRPVTRSARTAPAPRLAGHPRQRQRLDRAASSFLRPPGPKGPSGA